MNNDVLSVIESFSRDLTVLELHNAIQTKLLEFAEHGELMHRTQMRWFLSLWKPEMGDFPVALTLFGEVGLNATETKKLLTAIKWLQWSA